MRSLGLMSEALFAIKVHGLISEGQPKKAIDVLERSISSVKAESDSWAFEYSHVSVSQQNLFLKTSKVIGHYENGADFENLIENPKGWPNYPSPLTY